ncbi:MAG: hypothetical protein M1830_000174 [Pleopsidium flavum]|nr:MAG: hypothetical protein M1830_000174 [Pleopsidium flavum]
MTSNSPSSKQALETPTSNGSRAQHQWTLVDREDMFSRRQSGEGWDTICKDFPNRTRHAMQQQYSADGTFTPSNRGRKRRAPASRKWEAINQPDSDSTASDMSDQEDDTSITSYRPPTSSRSASDPATRVEEQDLPLFPNLQTGVTDKAAVTESRSKSPESRANAKVADVGPLTDALLSQYEGRIKKRKLSTEPTEPSKPTLTDSTDLQPQSKTPAVEPSDKFLTSEDAATIQAILSRADDTIRARFAAAEADQARRQALFDAALGRACRRANEAERKLQEETQRSSDIIKSIQECHAQAIEELKGKIAAAEGDMNTKPTIDALQKTLDDKEIELASKEQQLRLYDQLREQICSEVVKLSEAHDEASQTVAAIKDHQLEFDRKLTLLDADLSAMSIKTIQKYVDEVKGECGDIQSSMAAIVTQWQNARDAVITFRTQFPFREPDKCTLGPADAEETAIDAGL